MVARDAGRVQHPKGDRTWHGTRDRGQRDSNRRLGGIPGL